MNTKMKYLFLAFLSMIIGLVAGYLAKSLAVQLLTQSLALPILFLVVPDKFFKFTREKKKASTQEEEISMEVDSKTERHNGEIKKRKIKISVDFPDPMTNVFKMPPHNEEKKNFSIEEEEKSLEEVDDYEKKPANSDFVLVVAILVSSMAGGGIVLFGQNIPLALFAGTVLLVLILKYGKIKEIFTKKMMRFFNTE